MKIALAALALALPGVASAADVVNGGFEQPGVTNSCCTTTPTDALPGWNVVAGNVNVVNGTFSSNPFPTNLAFEGSQYLDLIGQGGVGSLSQTFATNIGSVYQLTFAYSHNLFGGLASAAADFSIDGLLAGTVSHSTGSTSNLDWRIYTGTFTALSSSATLNFTNTVGDGNAGLLIDAVAISAVPEPTTWAMMIGGLGLVGGVMRRRRRATIAFAA